MSKALDDFGINKLGHEILWGMSAVTNELVNNYEVIIDHNFGLDLSKYDFIDWNEEKVRAFVAQENSKNSGWTNKEFRLLLKEKEHIEKLHCLLDSILNEGESLDSRKIRKIVEEDRRAEKMERLLEEKQNNGNLEMGGKNTVKLTKSLSELSESLKIFEQNFQTQVNQGKIGDRKLYEKAWNLKDKPGKKMASKAASYSQKKTIETQNGIFHFGSVESDKSVELDPKNYQDSDYIVVDSLGFDYINNDFKEFMSNQPSAGRFDYGEVLVENIFHRKLPILIPDVMPTESIGKLDLTIIDELNSTVNMSAPAIGKGVLPATTALAAAGVIPVSAAFIGSITIKWQYIAPAVTTSVFLPRTLTALGARAALFCEKIDSEFASNEGVSKPVFYLNLHLKEAPLIILFLKYPKLRKFAMKMHRKAGFPGLKNNYTDIMKEIKFTPNGKKLHVRYEGKEKLVGYTEKEISTGIGNVPSATKKAKNLFSRLFN